MPVFGKRDPLIPPSFGWWGQRPGKDI